MAGLAVAESGGSITVVKGVRVGLLEVQVDKTSSDMSKISFFIGG